MGELDQLWAETHDAEQRLGRLEQQLAVIQSQQAAQASEAGERTASRRYVFSTLVGVISTVAFVLSLLAQLGVRL